MNLGQRVKDALAPLGVPLSFSVYIGSATTYITFFCYNEQGEEWSENEEIVTGYYVQVDIWSKGSYIDLADQVMTAMISAGFKRMTAQDLYESDTKTFHKALRFSYVDY